MDQRREFSKSLLLGLALTALSLVLHFLPIWETMLNRGAETWDGKPLPYDFIDACIQEHRLGPEAAFVRRPLVTWGIDVLGAMGLTSKTGFITLGFALFLVSGLLVHRIALALGSGTPAALIAQGFFHLSPTVLFAWFDPMYTYDEPIQYLALFLAMLAALRRDHLGFIIAFSVALIARETSVLLLPALVLLMGPGRRWVTVLAPILVYALFLYFHFQGTWLLAGTLLDLNERPQFLLFNFHDLHMGLESISYLALVLVLPVFLLARFHRSPACTEADRRMLRAFWVSLALNTLAVLLAAKAREARLFALPLIIGWPVLGKAVVDEVRRGGGLGSFLGFLRNPLWAIEFIVKAAVLSFSVHALFSMSTGIQQDNFFHEYLIAELLVLLICLYAGKHQQHHTFARRSSKFWPR